jgi:hypothetical protein
MGKHLSLEQTWVREMLLVLIQVAIYSRMHKMALFCIPRANGGQGYSAIIRQFIPECIDSIVYEEIHPWSWQGVFFLCYAGGSSFQSEDVANC